VRPPEVMACSASWLIRTRRVQSRRRRDGRRSLRSGRDRAEALRLAVAPASAGAATIHFAVIAQHFEEYWLFGAFFVGVALLQLAWGAARRPSPVAPPHLAGAAGNAVLAATWLVSRTMGLPLGPESGEPEAVGIADTVADRRCGGRGEPDGGALRPSAGRVADRRGLPRGSRAVTVSSGSEERAQRDAASVLV
jgi:hypothetical protein